VCIAKNLFVDIFALL